VNSDQVMALAQQLALTAFWCALPLVGSLVVVAVVFGFLQAALQLQDPVIGFVPKITALTASLFFFGPFILDRLTTQMRQILSLIGTR
jgi:flagellar biosynthetic protein FliQ